MNSGTNYNCFVCDKVIKEDKAVKVEFNNGKTWLYICPECNIDILKRIEEKNVNREGQILQK